MELKAKWVKTGPVDKKYQDSLSENFQEVMDHFFLRRRAYFEEKNRQIDEKILILQGYIDSVHQLRKAEDLDDSIIKVKELQKEWKNVILKVDDTYQGEVFPYQGLLRFWRDRSKILSD